MKWPSINNSNPRTWKCKIFGCRDEFLPLTYCEGGEQHGITVGFSYGTAVSITTYIPFKGCLWCKNFHKIYDEPIKHFPAWLCDCKICIEANQHRKWLY
jgi:hypothetical protein